MSAHIRKAALALAALLSSAAVAEEDPFTRARSLELDLLVREVVTRNPTVAAARAAFEAAAAKSDQVGVLENPMLRWDVAPLSLVGPAPLGTGVSLSQKLPLFGRRQLEADAARAEAESVRAEIGEAKLALVEAARSLFADHYATARAQDINDAHRKLLSELKRAAEAQYAAGMGSQQDALQADLLLAELEQERVELDARAAVVRARLNALLRRPLNAPLPPPPSTLEADLEVLDVEEAELGARPSLKAVDAHIAGSEAMQRRADRAWLPEIEVMASYNTMWSDPEHRFMVGVGLELPLQQGRRRAEQAGAQAEVRRLRLEREHLATELSAEAEEARQMLGAAVRTLSLQRDRVLPAARAQLEAARAGYSAGKNEFQSLIEAERGLRSAELKLHAALADVVRRRAAFDRVVGRLPKFLEEAP